MTNLDSILKTRQYFANKVPSSHIIIKKILTQWNVKEDFIQDDFDRCQDYHNKSEKVGLKLNIQKTKIMTSSPII